MLGATENSDWLSLLFPLGNLDCDAGPLYCFDARISNWFLINRLRVLRCQTPRLCPLDGREFGPHREMIADLQRSFQ